MKLKLTVIVILCFLFQRNVFSRNVEKEKTDKKRPNIIFILTDDQRWNAMGYAGNKVIQTPEMDKLAKGGAYFRNALVTTPICSASRASIFSGVQERSHRYTFQTGPIRDEFMADSYPVVLKKAGYYTGFFGKFGVNYANDDKLFDEFESYDRNGRFPDYRGYYYKTLNGDTVHLTRYTGQQALDFIEHVPSERPFCLSLSFSAPHAHDNAPLQYFWQEEADKLYQNEEMPAPQLAEDKYFESLPLPVREGFNRLRWTWRYDTPEKYQHSVKGYYRMIYGINVEIAKIREKLAAKGLADNTVIILMGDNGQFLGERQLAGKWLMYENSIRVPLIVYDPRVKKHRDIDEMALNIDVPATIVDLAGAAPPLQWQGKSLMPLVTGEEKSFPRDTILIEHLWEFENIPPSEGVRTSEWKYFRYVDNHADEELYNLKQDPMEINNLAKNSQYASVLLALRSKCSQLIQKYDAPYLGVPEGLMVEYIREPQNTQINDSKPEYSWIVPEKAMEQKAYQIIVASSQKNIDNNMGDVWDSKRVSSNRSVNIEHAGSALKANATYFWKVRIYDKDNRLSEYSESQMFHTGNFRGSVSSKNSFQIEMIKPTSVTKRADGVYFIDFGRDAFGTLAFSYQTKKPETLLVRLGEKLKNGKIDRDPGGTIRYQEVKVKVTPDKTEYILELLPDKRNTGPAAVHLPDSIGVITPFRYAEIEKASQPIMPHNVTQIACFHYFEYDNSNFSSSDSILNQVWEICKYSMKATSFAGLYVDGDRERIPYEADAYINQLGHYCIDREYPMAKQTIEWFMKHPTWPTEWLLHTPMLMFQDYYYSGDTELLAAYYEPLKKKTLLELAQQDGLISTESKKLAGEFMSQIGFADTTQRIRDIVDWPRGERDGYDMKPVNTVVNCFFYENMKIMAEIADVLGKTEDKLEFLLMAAKVKKAINNKLFDKENGRYIDGEGTTHASLHANMFPLAFDIVPEQYKKAVTEFVKSRGMACSVYAAQYLMEALYKAGEAQYALDLLKTTDERSWYNMIKSGSTITMEAWDMKYKPNSDWNHAWGAAPANIIPRYLWGIQPKTPGFGIVCIHPQMADLKESKIETPTIKGNIKGKYQWLNKNLQKYTVELPANMVGEFMIDFLPENEVTLNGEPVDVSFGTVRLQPGQNNIEIRTNSF